MIQAIISEKSGLTGNDYFLAPDVLLLLIQDGSARLLDLGRNCYAVSEIGTEMLCETLKANTTTAATRIATKYRAEVSLVQDDLHAFLRDLEEKQLISRFQQPRRVFQLRKFAFCFILMPLFHGVSRWPLSLEKRTWALLALASLSFRMLRWPETIALWRHYLRNHAPRRVPREGERDVDQVVRTVAARHPFHAECKERALVCWGLLRSAGFPARLVLGVNLFPLECHCWCETGHMVLSDDHVRCKRFTPVLSYE